MKDYRHTYRWQQIRLRVLAGRPTLCGICHGERGPIRYDVDHRHPMAATVDHIVPVAQVDHMPDAYREEFCYNIGNLQPAHKVCNDTKQDSPPSQHAVACNPGKIAWYSK